ncbi:MULTISPECIES: EAL domain-containing protein [unclassified Moraxella]|uniref:EAL domain-containing protein n=1 Tax=unclassified Moraxella TaxID=2685852 RepID=UPI003AF9AEA5
MKSPNQLNLLIIDDNQLYAEQLIDLLQTSYYKKVNLGFLDAKDELLKLLRQSWDVLIMGKAYDLSLAEVVQILKEQQIDLPVIGILPEAGIDTHALTAKEQAQLAFIKEDDLTNPAQVLFEYWGAVDVLPKTKLMAMAMRVYREHYQLQTREELASLKNVLNDAEQRANILIKNSKSAVAYIEDGLHIYANDPYLEMFGFKSLEDLMGVPVVDLIASNNIKDFKHFLKDFEKGNRNNVEFKFESVRTDSSTFAAKLQLAAATYEGEPCQQVIIQPNEQGNSAELAKKIAIMERIDPLTGMYNRRGYEQVLNAIRDTAVQQSLTVGLLAIRIDNMGKISSSVGIQGVDTTVIAIANLLKQKIIAILGEDSVKKGYISRFSDSHFMLFMPNAIQEQVEAWAKQLLEEVENSLIEVGHRTIKVTVTIGATMINSSSPDSDTLTNRVTQAVNIAVKNNNNEGNAFYLYDPSAFASSDDASLLEALRTTLEQGKFNLMYQPIYDVEKDTSNMFEVFLRLPLADGTLMPPDKFLAVAEQHGLMDKIDRWVLIRACKDLKQYRSQVDPTARILVHLSPSSLVDETLPAFISQLSKAVGGQDREVIGVQFSEAMFNDYLAVGAKQTDDLKQVGCQVGIYNFGSALNGIELLDFVKPNLVRLDRSYVKDLGNSENVETISSLVTQVNERHVNCLMAFIEDPAAMSAAWTIGARYLQGNYLQAPSETMHIETESA